MRAPIVLAERRQHRREARLLELQRLQFLHDGLVELARGLAPLRRYRIGGLHIGLARGFRRPRQAFERAAAIVERRQLRRDVAAQGRQAVDRYIVLARERPERKEALLAFLQTARIAAERASLRLDLGYRFARLERRALQRRRRRVQPAGGLVLEPLDMPQRGAQRPLGAALAAEFAQCRVQRLAQALLVHQQRAFFGQRRLLARLGLERVDLAQRMAQEFFLGAGRLEPRRGGIARRIPLAPFGPAGCQGLLPRRRHAIGVESLAMRRRIQQPALRELPLDLDQRFAELA